MAILSQKHPKQVKVIEPIVKLVADYPHPIPLRAGLTAGLDMARRAYGHAIQPELMAEWAKRKGLRRSPGRCCIQRLLGKSCGFGLHPCGPPHTDHPSLWLKDSKPYCYISQPYGLDMEKLEDIAKFCQQFGLTFTIDSWPAWYFPNAVLFLTFTKAEAPNGSDLSRG